MTINFDLQEEIQALQESDNDGYAIPHEHDPTEEDIGRLLEGSITRHVHSTLHLTGSRF